MAVHSLTAELWPQQLPALVIHTVHRSVKARRYRYSYPNLNVQLLQSVIAWIPLEMESSAVRSLEVQLLAVYSKVINGWSSTQTTDKMKMSKSYKELYWNPAKWIWSGLQNPYLASEGNFLEATIFFWDGFCKALSSLVVQSSSQECDSGIPFFVVVIYLF